MSVSSSPVHLGMKGRSHERRGSAALGVADSKNDITEFRRVLVLYTGGTIGMVRGDDGALIPKPNEFEKKLRENPQMHDKKYAKAMFGSSSDMSPLVLPFVEGMKRVVYSVTEYEPLLDSSNMTMKDWSNIANDIYLSYESFDGFVILHGTDTMSYTAAALSFMLENLGKTVIITGSQVQQLSYESFDGFVILHGTDTMSYTAAALSFMLENLGKTVIITGSQVQLLSYESFDGFVILHGTDTMSYTAAALSFMLENLGKTVIITGSQISIFEVRNDGIDNFLSSLLIAGNFVIPEVTLFFNYKLLRGNRSVKISTESFNAFESPNVPPLAIAGINFEVDYRSIFRPCSIDKFRVHGELNENVGLLRVFPSILTNTIASFLKPPMQGVVLQTYGAGNMPTNREDLLEVLTDATKSGIIIVNITQCSTGSVSGLYETGKLLYDAGVISGFDMTPEAALTKLAYVLSKDDWDLATKRNMLKNNLRGELTSGGMKPPVLEDWDLVDAVARSLHISSPREVKLLHAILFPAMLGSAVEKGDTDKIVELKNYGADVSATNSDRRTPLHIACGLGNLKVVKFLLLNGASVHMKDRFDQTPLLDAIKMDHVEVIKLLRRCGAHLTLTPSQIGSQLCSAASYGNLKRLSSLLAAGANMNQADISGRTALHQAAVHNHQEIAEFLISNGALSDVKDSMGMTPADIAKHMKHLDIANLLQCNNNNEDNIV